MGLVKPKLVQPKEYTTRDDFRTPFYAVECIVPYIPRGIPIWECAYGEGHIVRSLRYFNFEVYSSDIFDNGADFIVDFLKDSSPLQKPFIIVTNPPYSLKKEFIYKAIDYDIPFAFLISADYSQWLINVLEMEGVQRITPRKRINFITPHKKLNTSAYFHTYWLVRYFNLPKDEIFVEINQKGWVDVE